MPKVSDEAHFFNVGSVLLHGDFFHARLKTKKRLYFHCSWLFKAGPVRIVGMHLRGERSQGHGHQHHPSSTWLQTKQVSRAVQKV